MDPDSWQTIMDKMYVDWSPQKASEGEWCKAHNDYEHTPANLVASLSACEVIGYNEVNEIETRFRSKMFQPHLYNDDKPLFMYYAGKKQEKYVVIGCIKCQRATSIMYREPKARETLLYYFPDPQQ